MSQCIAVRCSALQYVAVCCKVCTCCSVLCRVAVGVSAIQTHCCKSIIYHTATHYVYPLFSHSRALSLCICVCILKGCVHVPLGDVWTGNHTIRQISQSLHRNPQNRHSSYWKQPSIRPTISHIYLLLPRAFVPLCTLMRDTGNHTIRQHTQSIITLDCSRSSHLEQSFVTPTLSLTYLFLPRAFVLLCTYL